MVAKHKLAIDQIQRVLLGRTIEDAVDQLAPDFNNLPRNLPVTAKTTPERVQHPLATSRCRSGNQRNAPRRIPALRTRRLLRPHRKPHWRRQNPRRHRRTSQGQRTLRQRRLLPPHGHHRGCPRRQLPSRSLANHRGLRHPRRSRHRHCPGNLSSSDECPHCHQPTLQPAGSRRWKSALSRPTDPGRFPGSTPAKSL